MNTFSQRVIAALSHSQASLSPWSAEMLAAFEAEHGAVSALHREVEQALFEASGRRGLPVISGFAYGIVAAHRAAPPGTPPVRVDKKYGNSTLLAWSHALGVGLYVYENGRVERGSNCMLSPDVRAFIERQVIEVSRPWSAVSLVLSHPYGKDLADALGVPRIFDAQDDWRTVWEGSGYFIVRDTRETRVRFVNLSAAKRVLALCAEKGDRVYCESTAPYERIDGGGEPSDELERSADYRRDGFVTALARGEPNAVTDAWVHAGRVLHERTFTETVTRIRSLRASKSLDVPLSARALAFLDGRPPFLRDPSRTCDRATLARELERFGITDAPEALFAFERDFGGVALLNSDTARPLWALGPYTILSGDADVIQSFRLDPDDPDDPDRDDDEPVVLRRDLWPRVRWQSVALYPVGDEKRGSDDEVHLYIDEAGVIYRYTGMFNELETAAGSARTYIELRAFRGAATGRYPDFAPATIGANLGEALSAELGLSAIAEASDPIVSSWLGEDLDVRSWIDHGPSRARMEIISRTPEAMLRAVKLAHDLAPKAPIRLRDDLPGGHVRFAALREAGLPVKEG